MAKIMIFLLFSVIGTYSLFSQEEEAEKELQAVRKITQLTSEHEFLKSMAGNWKLLGLNHAGGEESPLTGSAVINSIMFDHYLEINLKIEKFGGFMTSRMIIGFDTRTDKFTLYSFDDMTNFSQYSTGTKTGNKISFKGKDYNMQEKKEMPYRIDIELERENKLIMELFFINGKKEFLNTEYQMIKKNG